MKIFEAIWINHKSEETHSHIPNMCENQILLKRGKAMSKISCEPPDTLFVLKNRLVRYIIVACDLDYQGGYAMVVMLVMGWTS